VQNSCIEFFKKYDERFITIKVQPKTTTRANPNIFRMGPDRGVARRVWAPPLKILSRALAAIQNFGGGGFPNPPAPAVPIFS